MSDALPDIKSVVVRVITDKPVRKTPYQVKGVFMRQYPDEPIIPLLDGSYRDRFLYPRVQVKILNEQIYIIGIHEGADPVLDIVKKFENFDFGNITFTVQDCDIENISQQFIPSTKLIRYRFITPWVALNHMTGGKYKFLTNQEKPSYLNKLLGQNIIFLANELGAQLKEDIFTKVQVPSLLPESVDDNKWGAFMGEFKTNFVLPNYIGIGNGITRGFGTLYSLFNSDSFTFNEKELKESFSLDENTENIIADEAGLERVSVTDMPKPRRTRRKSSKRKRNKPKKMQGANDNSKKPKQGKYNSHGNPSSKSKQKFKKSGRVFSEEFDIEEQGPQKDHASSEDNEDRFNTEKHHKRQHKF